MTRVAAALPDTISLPRTITWPKCCGNRFNQLTHPGHPGQGARRHILALCHPCAGAHTRLTSCLGHQETNPTSFREMSIDCRSETVEPGSLIPECKHSRGKNKLPRTNYSAEASRPMLTHRGDTSREIGRSKLSSVSAG
jgi:hypothetical protein